jgi:hypothetical protein
MAATPSAISDRLSMLTEASVGSSAIWMTSAGKMSWMRTRPTCWKPLNRVRSGGGTSSMP